MKLQARLAVLALIAVAPLPLLAAPVVAQTPADQPAIRVVGGTPAPDAYTFAARLEHGGNSRLVYSSWVYNPWTILTDAHCVTPLPSTSPTAAALGHFGGWLSGPAGAWLTGTTPVDNPTHYLARTGTDALGGNVVRVRHIVARDFGWGPPDNLGRINELALLLLDWHPKNDTPDQLLMADPTRVPSHLCLGSGTDEICAAAPAGVGTYFGDSTGPDLRTTASPLSTTAVTAHVSQYGRPGGCGDAPQTLVTPSTNRDWKAQQAARDALLRHPTDLAAR